MRLRRAAVIDLDVHQGNGTAAILAPDPLSDPVGYAWAKQLYGEDMSGGGDAVIAGGRGVFTASLHGDKNYPWKSRVHGSYDEGVPDDCSEDEYIDATGRLL